MVTESFFSFLSVQTVRFTRTDIRNRVVFTAQTETFSETDTGYQFTFFCSISEVY